MEFAIETVGLSKRFAATRGYRDLMPFRKRKYVEALRSVTLQVPQGGVFGLLGPNGAGKTTLFKILGTLSLPTTGEASVFGIDVARKPSQVKRLLTYVVSEERSLYWRLTGKQNLQYFAALFNISRRDSRRRIADLLALLELEDAADKRVMYYSTGMRQKLAMARGLLSDPEILLLDEPTRSLDPLVAQSLWRFIKEDLVARQGKTILMATHNLDEARRECDRIAVLHHGEVRASGTVEDLTRFLAGTIRYDLKFLPSGNGIHALISEVPGVHDVRVLPVQDEGLQSVEFALENPGVQVPQVLERVMAAGGKVVACSPRERPLSEVLAELIGTRPS